MRTTVDLPDELVRAARVRAAQTDESLKELFTRALTRELGQPGHKQRRQLPVISSARPATSTVTPDELAELLSNDETERDLT